MLASMGREASLAAVERFRLACDGHRLVTAAFLGGSYAAGTARDDSDIDVYAVTAAEDYDAFVAERERFMRSWGDPLRLEDVWNFEGLGFDMIRFQLADGVHGELALGHTENMMRIHGGPYRVLVDRTGLLDGVVFPLL
jgi:predicted nucleotidyltransferase